MSTVEQIANAVLYEGYILYPYQHSAVKNRQRWNFGVVYPRDYVGTLQGWDPCFMQTECLVEGTPLTALQAKVKFLHIVAHRALEPSSEVAHENWQETVEREVIIPVCPVSEIAETLRQPFQFLPGDQNELIEGAVELTASQIQEGVYRIRVSISNLTALANADRKDRNGALLRSMVSTHTILRVTNGKFISLLDPPEEFRKAAAGCQNVGAWPVLAGESGQCGSMLSSPIILYDYPEIAPESPGDLFDGTEIDEILTLRIMTMTDREKNEMRHSGEHARRILERTEALPPEHLAKLHGALRGLHTVRTESNE